MEFTLEASALCAAAQQDAVNLMQCRCVGNASLRFIVIRNAPRRLIQLYFHLFQSFVSKFIDPSEPLGLQENNTEARYSVVKWSKPSSENGILRNYTVRNFLVLALSSGQTIQHVTQHFTQHHVGSFDH